MSTTWTPPAPRELRAFREDVLLSLGLYEVHFETQLAMANNLGSIRPEGPPSRAASVLLAEETNRLRTARLYSVSAEMTSVAMAAGKKLPSWEVRAADLPSKAGFAVFDLPIDVYKGLFISGPVSIVAVSWGPTYWQHNTEPTVWVTFWSTTPPERAPGLAPFTGQNSPGEIADLQRRLGPLTWDNEALLTFDSPQVRVADGQRIKRVDPTEGHSVKGTTLGRVQTVRALWLLMKREGKRPIADVEELPHSKTVRRAMERDGMDPAPVRVVTLHRELRQRSKYAPAEGYKQKVQSLVGGHVRWQPYPRRGVIEPIWIDDYVKGPPGAPFSQRRDPGSTVYRLDRPPGGQGK